MRMAKKINLLCDPNMLFSIGDDAFRASALTVEQAELVAAQYPGRYVEIVEEKSNSSAKSVEPIDATKK